MAEVDAQTIRDATTARIEAEEAQQTADEAQRTAQWTEEDLRGIRDQMGRLEERVADAEVVLGGVVTYLVDEEEHEEQPAEPEHTEVEPRAGAHEEDQAPAAEHRETERHCGTLW